MSDTWQSSPSVWPLFLCRPSSNRRRIESPRARKTRRHETLELTEPGPQHHHSTPAASALRSPGSVRFHKPRIRRGRREQTSGFIRQPAFHESHGLSELYDRRLADDRSDYGGGEKADIHADRRCIKPAVRLHEHSWPHRVVEHRRQDASLNQPGWVDELRLAVEANANPAFFRPGVENSPTQELRARRRGKAVESGRDHLYSPLPHSSTPRLRAARSFDWPDFRGSVRKLCGIGASVARRGPQTTIAGLRGAPLAPPHSRSIGEPDRRRLWFRALQSPLCASEHCQPRLAT